MPRMIRFEINGLDGAVLIPRNAPPELLRLWQTGRCPECTERLTLRRHVRESTAQRLIHCPHRNGCKVADMKLYETEMETL